MSKLNITELPDGSGFFTASLPLPKDHWLYAPQCTEWDSVRGTGADTPLPILDNSQRESVKIAAKYALRGATMNGQEMDFDPDALVLNMAYALCGSATNQTNPTSSEPVAWRVEEEGATWHYVESPPSENAVIHAARYGRKYQPLFTHPSPLTAELKAELICHLSSLQDYISDDIGRLDSRYSHAIRRGKLYRDELVQVTAAIDKLNQMGA